MFNTGQFATDPGAINRSWVFPQTAALLRPGETRAGAPALGSASLPALLGRSPDSLPPLDCAIQQKHNQTHADLFRAMAVSGAACTQSGEKRPPLPSAPALWK